jgi:hypothetical protein
MLGYPQGISIRRRWRARARQRIRKCDGRTV